MASIGHIGFEGMCFEKMEYLICAVLTEKFFGLHNLHPGDSIDIPIKSLPDYQELDNLVAANPMFPAGLLLSIQGDNLHVLFQPAIQFSFSSQKMHIHASDIVSFSPLGLIPIQKTLSFPEHYLSYMAHPSKGHDVFFIFNGADPESEIDNWRFSLEDYSGLIVTVSSSSKGIEPVYEVYQNKLYPDTLEGLTDAWIAMKQAKNEKDSGCGIFLSHIFSENSYHDETTLYSCHGQEPDLEISEFSESLYGERLKWAEKVVEIHHTKQEDILYKTLHHNQDYSRFLKDAKEMKKSILNIQNLIDKNFDEIQAYALSHPYNEEDRFQIMVQGDLMQEILFFLWALIMEGREPDILNKDRTLDIDWHLPAGAVGNAFKVLNRINAYEKYTLPLECRKLSTKL